MQTVTNLVSLLLLLSAAAAAPAKEDLSDQFILNGHTASQGQFPFTAKISGCTASILNSRTILTAAHCVCETRPTWVEVGSVYSGTGQGTVYRISNTYIYPGYPTGPGCSRVSDYDFAVLKTTSDIQFNSNVQPISLWTWSAPSANTQIISMGYGGDENGRSNVLKYAYTVLTNSNCYGGYLCSSRSPNSIYFGDSGGPMVVKSGSTFYQLGVNSGISSSTSLYAHVPNYQSFIKRYM